MFEPRKDDSCYNNNTLFRKLCSRPTVKYDLFLKTAVFIHDFETYYDSVIFYGRKGAAPWNKIGQLR